MVRIPNMEDASLVRRSRGAWMYPLKVSFSAEVHQFLKRETRRSGLWELQFSRKILSRFQGTSNNVQALKTGFVFDDRMRVSRLSPR